MGKPLSSVELNFLKSIKIELSDEALVFMVSKIQWNYFFFHFFLRKNIDHRFCFVPTDDLRVFGILSLLHMYT
jgi:hypothetical protein